MASRICVKSRRSRTEAEEESARESSPANGTIPHAVRRTQAIADSRTRLIIDRNATLSSADHFGDLARKRLTVWSSEVINFQR